MNAPAIFQNGEFQLRVTAAGDSFRVEAPGLAKALGFHEARDLVRSIPDDEKGSELVPTLGGSQRVTYLTEPGFYRALGQRQAARVKDPAVREQVGRFQNWVYGDMLPTIRRTGGYGQQAAAPALDTPEGVLALAAHFHETAKRLVFAEAKVAELAPAAENWTVLASAKGDYSLREAAFMLSRDPVIEIGQNRLMRFIRDESMVDAKGRPYASHVRHLVERPVSYDHPRTGEPVLTSQLRVTVAGLEYLRRRLGGIRAVAA